MYDPGLMELLHHVQDADGEVEHQRLWHHLLAAALVQVYSVLEDEMRSGTFTRVHSNRACFPGVVMSSPACTDLHTSDMGLTDIKSHCLQSTLKNLDL